MFKAFILHFICHKLNLSSGGRLNIEKENRKIQFSLGIESLQNG